MKVLRIVGNCLQASKPCESIFQREVSTLTGVLSFFKDTARLTDEINFPVTDGDGVVGSTRGIPIA